jgi:uncharacterized protein YegJ (DUF2314 family)
MSESLPSRVFLFNNEDPAMQQAYAEARKTFRYFWRELSWERRRIIPGLSIAAVKAPFADPPNTPKTGDDPQVEHMWIDDVEFDGRLVRGTLLNEPNWLKTVKQGTPVSKPLCDISDWMYAIGDEVFGAYTVNLMRSRMTKRERAEHDAAWGLDFGDPNNVRVVPQERKSGFFQTLFKIKSPPIEIGEHPMSENMAPALREQLTESPELVKNRDDRGWTFLHQFALAGSCAAVQILLEFGADPRATTDDGDTPLQLARSLQWDKVAALLTSATTA